MEQGARPHVSASRKPWYLTPANAPTSAWRLLITVAGSIIAAEVLAMFFLSARPDLSVAYVIALDAVFLTIVAIPVLYFFLFHPLVREITERQRVEDQLRKANEFSETMVKTIPLGMDILDEQGRILYMNENIKKLVGRNAEGEFCASAYRRTGEWCEHCPLLVGVAPGKTQTVEIDRVLGDRIFSITYTGMSYGGKKAALRVLEDVTESKRLEEQLLQAQKMEAVGRLAGGVAHDFNNLLTAIQGYSELLLSRLGEESLLRKDVEKICMAGERAASLTRQLLAFSRRQMLQPKILDLNALVADMRNLLCRLIGEDIELVTTIETSLESVRADAGQIGQVVMNLAVNARDAMPSGGKLTIRACNVTIDAEYCGPGSEARPGRFVCLSIEDTGVGIEKALLGRIFEPFFTTKGPGVGTGLGLSTVYGIVKQHDGWIEVASEIRHGTTFRIYLPSVSELPVPEAARKASEAELRGSGERILLVEDEEEVRSLGARILRENGYDVVEAADAKEALGAFEKEERSFDLVFSDVVLPDRSGPELVDRILTMKPDLKVLFTSGYADHKSQWPVIQGEGFPFLQKPYAPLDLLQALRNALKPRPAAP